jgi:hypothetical protein
MICWKGFQWSRRGGVRASNEALGGRSLHHRKCLGRVNPQHPAVPTGRQKCATTGHPARHSARRPCPGDRIIEMAATYYYRYSDCDAID